MFQFFRRKIKTLTTSYPGLPGGLTLYVIGDVHGRLDLLEAVQQRIEVDSRGAYEDLIEIYLGDLVDRGPNSAGVINNLLNRLSTRQTVCIQGNHEAMMLNYLAGALTFTAWRKFGGVSTLLSYGVDVEGLRNDEDLLRAAVRRAVPDVHQRFLHAMPLHLVCGGYVFVHAGLRPVRPLRDQTREDQQWIRDDFLKYNGDFGHIVVHGHTPVPEPQFLSNRIAIDTGAFATNRLTCLRINEAGPTLLAV